MTKEDFNNTIEVGDIITVVGIDSPVDCVVMTKTEYACNLFTVKQSDTADGIMRPCASYYRSYNEVIEKVSSDHSLYEQYLDLIAFDKINLNFSVPPKVQTSEKS